MAEQEDAQEKTEEATPRRLEKAKEEGQIARSRELATTLILMGGSLGLWVLGGQLAKNFGDVMRYNLSFDRRAILDERLMFTQLGDSLFAVMQTLFLLLTIMFVLGVLANLLQGGWLLSGKPLMPRLERLNPIAGLKRMFSLKALVELFKAIAKFLLVALVAVFVLAGFESSLLDIGKQDLRPALAHASNVILWASLALAAVTILIAAVDVPFQQYDHRKNLRMTRQQVKDEMKDTEGRPEVKGRIRQLQRELAASRMMAEVPEADVVITNPEHYAVALRYDTSDLSGATGAPLLIAKGADQLALKIREIAYFHEVPIIESAMLARAIFYTTELDSEIPEKLYLAVAQVLAFIHQVRTRMRNRYAPASSELRSLNEKLAVPDEYQFDASGKRLADEEKPE